MRGHLRARDQRSAKSRRAHRRRAEEQHWELVVSGGYAIAGKRVQKRRTFVGTKEAAEEALRAFLDEVKGGAVCDARLTLGEYIVSWMDDKRTEGLAYNTLRRYESMNRFYITPALGAIPIAKLRPAHVKDALRIWRTGKRNDRKKTGGLSGRTVHHCFSFLWAVMAEAVRDEKARSNPCAAVRAPSKGENRIRIPNDVEVVRLLDALDKTDVGVVARLAAYSGLRRGELLALRWRDIDFEQRTLEVRESLEQAKDAKGNALARFKSPKTVKSGRVIALPLVAIEKLKAWRGQYAARLLGSGSSASPNDLVFPMPDEYHFDPQRPWIPDVLSAAFYYQVGASGLPRITLHGLRHCYATFALKAGIPIKVVSEQLGHTSVKTTGDIYTGVLDELKHDAAERLDDLYSRAENRRRTEGGA